jgi:hypothetical protein
MNIELEKIEKLFLSNSFSEVDAYSSKFDLFKMMGVRSKELVHSNIIACLLNPSYPHGLNYSFLNTFTKGVVGLGLVNGEPIPLSRLISATDDHIRVFRELENIDLVIEYTGSKLVIAIENKVWASEQKNQIARYQDTLKTRYPGYTTALIFLTPDAHAPETVNLNSEVPVYCMSYEQLAELLKQVKNQANETALNFINQFIYHIGGYMSDSSEVRELCWQLFNKHEEAYAHMVKSHAYCLERKVKEIFFEIESRIKIDSMFSRWSDSLVIKNNNVQSKKDIITCDLDVRLKHWPEGLWVKIYKHSWFAVFPFVYTQNLVLVESLSKNLRGFPNKKVKAWDNKYYVSSNDNLDSERMILMNGNSVSKEHINIALSKLGTHIDEIEGAINDLS